MGLQLQKFINGNGYIIEEGYFEVDEIHYKVESKTFYFNGNIWVSKDIKDEGFRPIDRFEDSFELEELPNEDIVTFTYKHIMETAAQEDVLETNPRYKGFIGCIQIDALKE